MFEPLPLSFAMKGITPASGSPREVLRSALTLAKHAGCAAIQIDGTLPGLRARELDQSARRDVSATLRRAGLGLSGIDLWIPPEQFAAASKVDRAVSATIGAIELAADLRGDGVWVGVRLPPNIAQDVVGHMENAGERWGVRVVDFSVRDEEEGPRFKGIAAGVDPALQFAAGRDPVKAVVGLGRKLAAARLSDADRSGAPCVPGEGGGRLDVMAYGTALMACGYGRAVVLDVGGAQSPSGAAFTAAVRWREALRGPD